MIRLSLIADRDGRDTISCPGISTADRLYISNSLGEVILVQENVDLTSPHEVGTKSLSSGLYVISVIVDEKEYSKKVIKLN